jgi:hypothetical protein
VSRRAYGREAGTTLIEVLVAMLILVSGVLAMAQLFLIAASTNAAAHHSTASTIVAAQKIEELRGLASLSLSPSTALERNTAGFVDHVDSRGRVVGETEVPPGQAVYTRRWSVETLSSGGGDALLIRVLSMRSHVSRKPDARGLGEAHLVAVMKRKHP